MRAWWGTDSCLPEAAPAWQTETPVPLGWQTRTSAPLRRTAGPPRVGLFRRSLAAADRPAGPVHIAACQWLSQCHPHWPSQWEKGDRHHLCEAPSGPFRQMVPVPFSRSAIHLNFEPLCRATINQPLGHELGPSRAEIMDAQPNHAVGVRSQGQSYEIVLRAGLRGRLLVEGHNHNVAALARAG